MTTLTRVCDALEWALDLLDLYDERMGKEAHSEAHMKAKAEARAALALLKPPRLETLGGPVDCASPLTPAA